MYIVLIIVIRIVFGLLLGLGLSGGCGSAPRGCALAFRGAHATHLHPVRAVADDMLHGTLKRRTRVDCEVDARA